MKLIHRISLALAICASASAFAAEPDSAKTQYDTERARCMSGASGQDQASCLKSAGAAYDAIRGNRLHDANTTYDANAMTRCQNLPPADRTDCESRVREGTKSSSVEAGGDIKETVTRSPVTK